MQRLDKPVDEAFEAITNAVARYFGVPVALVSLVDEPRHWLKSEIDLEACERQGKSLTCSDFLKRREPLIVPDTLLDDRFRSDPIVTDEPFCRFYACVPIRMASRDLGTLCILDTQPRAFSQTDENHLSKMAHLVARQIRMSARMSGMDSAPPLEAYC